ncbi:MAG: glutamate racemase [Spirochaetaceae bacterium]|nr:MAG: glutamate racemase [Spirochaetaceae bacterium]
MTDRPVLVLDSGIGGLPYVAAVRELLPAADIVYLADHAVFPYGEQDPETLCRHLLRLVAMLIERHQPAAVLLACNTASVVALAALRERFSVPFVGVVPAVKPAAVRTITRRIGVLATARTVKEHYLHDLVHRFAGQCVVTSVAAGAVVRLVEQCYGAPGADAVERAVRSAVGQLLHARVDTVVLGCTHFTFLIDQLRQLFGPTVSLIDSRDGVARQVQRVVQRNGDNARFAPRQPGSDRFLTSGTRTAELETLVRRYGFAEVRTL